MNAFDLLNYSLYLLQKQHYMHDENKTFPRIGDLIAFHMGFHHTVIGLQRNQAVGATEHNIHAKTIVQSAENK